MSGTWRSPLSRWKPSSFFSSGTTVTATGAASALTTLLLFFENGQLGIVSCLCVFRSKVRRIPV